MTMEYENHGYFGINRALLLILIFGALIYYFVNPIGMITKNTSSEIVPEPTKVPESNVSIIEYVYITVTPTPDNINYFASEFEKGIRKINRVFSFHRTDVSGLKDMTVKMKVYDYKEFDKYNWFNPQDYIYYQQYPSQKDYKFAFVFFTIWMDDYNGDDVTLYLPNSSQYVLQAGDEIYSPIPFVKQLRIMELEETFNDNNNDRVDYFMTDKQYNRNLEYRDTAGETIRDLTILRGGKSNAIDGYIVYEIPKESFGKDKFFLVNFHAFGDVGWKINNFDGGYAV